jgi:hypothetical protein
VAFFIGCGQEAVCVNINLMLIMLDSYESDIINGLFY